MLCHFVDCLLRWHSACFSGIMCSVAPNPMRPVVATPAKFAEVPIGESFVCERLPGWHVACWKTTTRTADVQFPEKVGTKDEWARWYFKASDDVTRGPVVFA